MLLKRDEIELTCIGQDNFIGMAERDAYSDGVANRSVEGQLSNTDIKYIRKKSSSKEIPNGRERERERQRDRGGRRHQKAAVVQSE